MGKLPLQFYRRSARIVARQLLGKVLVHELSDGTRLSGVIVETEAYLGERDAAAHSYGLRRTARTEPMYLPGGHTYVYFIYGMHECFNVVANRGEVPEAVLIRALEPLDGITEMQSYRGKNRISELASGPGKLCQALKITRAYNGHRLDQKPLWIEDPRQKTTARPSVRRTQCGPRIGIDYAGDAKNWPLRFWWDPIKS